MIQRVAGFNYCFRLPVRPHVFEVLVNEFIPRLTPSSSHVIRAGQQFRFDSLAQTIGRLFPFRSRSATLDASRSVGFVPFDVPTRLVLPQLFNLFLQLLFPRRHCVTLHQQEQNLQALLRRR